jgi:hypothetical protein
MTKANGSHGSQGTRLRSQLWFDNPDNPGMTALYLERYVNYGLTRAELTSGKPIIGIAQTGSDLSPCNRHHLELAKRVREGIRDESGEYHPRKPSQPRKLRLRRRQPAHRRSPKRSDRCRAWPRNQLRQPNRGSVSAS